MIIIILTFKPVVFSLNIMDRTMETEKIKIVKNLLRLGAFLQREGNRLLNKFNLNQQQFVVLKEIQERGPLSQRDICSELLFEKSNVSKIVKKLAVNKLVNITCSSEDNRISLLIITRKGNKVVEQCMMRLDQWNMDWLKSLSEKEIKQATKMLDRLNNLQNRR